MEKLIEIDGRMVPFKATGATPLHYRNRYNRDLLMDMQNLSASNDSKQFSVASLEVFEKVAYIMAWSASEDRSSFPATEEEWLDQFSLMSIYEVLPQLIELWGLNNKTLSKGKKK